MKRIIALLALGFGLGSGVAQAQFFAEDFETKGYSTGPLAAQSMWEEWLGGPGVDADVVDVNFNPALPVEWSIPNAVRITGQPAFGQSGNDVVWDFTNSGGQPTSGRWIVSTRTFVPSSASGVGWFIMLNQYPTATDWSLQLHFDADNNVFHPVEPVGVDVPLVYDTWVDLVVIIDLDRDRVDVMYDGQSAVTRGPWVGTGSRQIACIDLYGGEPTSNGITDLFYDDLRVVSNPGAAGMSLSSAPGPVPDGGTVTVSVNAPLAKSGIGVGFVTSVNGIPYVQKLLSFPLDGAGLFQLQAPLPPGLSGLEVDLLAIGLKNSRLHLSNLNTLIIR